MFAQNQSTEDNQLYQSLKFGGVPALEQILDSHLFGRKVTPLSYWEICQIDRFLLEVTLSPEQTKSIIEGTRESVRAYLYGSLRYDKYAPDLATKYLGIAVSALGRCDDRLATLKECLPRVLSIGNEIAKFVGGNGHHREKDIALTLLERACRMVSEDFKRRVMESRESFFDRTW